jgi:formylglycine-generating enzyme required for sulfatase activity
MKTPSMHEFAREFFQETQRLGALRDFLSEAGGKRSDPVAAWIALAELYDAGTGLKRNPEEAAKWLKRAEAVDNAGAQMNVKVAGAAFVFCRCPVGKFTMGSPASEEGRSSDEGPVAVTLSQGFWMAETPVTQAQWEAVMGSNPSHFRGASLPVEQVSWDDAQGMVAKLNRSGSAPAGLRFALPTEAQWEYACRAGTQTAYAFGNQITQKDAALGLQQSVPVKSYRPNRWGLYDMHGNVWEWCEDWYDEQLRGGVDPKGPPQGVRRVIRGGGWRDVAVGCRAAIRYGRVPGDRGDALGFRPALVPSR